MKEEITNKVQISFELRDIINRIWLEKIFISKITSIAAVISVFVALALPNFYSASALLAPADQSTGSLSGMMQRVGGIASLAGISLPSGDEGNKVQLGIELMTSRSFIGNFVERRNLLPDLMAFESWDMSTGEIEYDSDIYDIDENKWVRDVSLPYKPKPSVLEAHEQFMRILNVSQDKITGYVSVSIEHKSPIIASQWVNWLVEDINSEVRMQDIDEANRSISYLKDQITSTSLAELQSVFFELIQSQTETAMLAGVRPEYVFKTIDPAIIPEKQSRPKRAIICILGTILGSIIAIVIVMFRYYSIQKSHQSH